MKKGVAAVPPSTCPTRCTDHFVRFVYLTVFTSTCHFNIYIMYNLQAGLIESSAAFTSLPVD